ncbi:MAG: hypothetical protein KAG43_02150 [Candidatus Marithrix sp.]|nr:hypothetical protein [Candidatus Marithrix sp.]
MKRMRWKSKYLVGISEIDNNNKQLTYILNDLVLKSSQLEHCQDLSDLHEQISDIVEDMLQKKQMDEMKLKSILTQGLPLQARGTQACHSCDLCDNLNEQISDWLGSGNNHN